MATVAQSLGPVKFNEALLQANARARALYPTEKARIESGTTIALDGMVHFYQDGSADVESQTQPGVHYHVNGGCTCPDTRAPGARCKHRWARSLCSWAHKILSTDPIRFYATYYAPGGDEYHGIATWTDHGWLFVDDDGMNPLFAANEALHLHGNVELADAQLALDMAQAG